MISLQAHSNCTHAPHELSLLDLDAGASGVAGEQESSHDILTAPLISADAYTCPTFQRQLKDSKMQYGLFGQVNAVVENGVILKQDDPRLYVNTNAPFSALVCGVQGAGKSHTVSTILESMLITDVPCIGTLERPLAGLVFHYGDGGQGAKPCEAAYLAQPSRTTPLPKKTVLPKVNVFVSPTSLKNMKRVYQPLGGRVTVQALKFSPEELDVQAIRALMAVGQGDNIPLYMHSVLNILRDLGDSFTYEKFLNQINLAKKNFTSQQRVPLEQRLALLEWFVEKDRSSSAAKTAVANRFSAGQLTIIDLSDVYIDPPTASTLFEIVTRIFIRKDLKTGKVLLLDEGHKYLTPSNGGGANALTKTMLRLIREQRHLGLRVIISTQEPTVVPSVLIDLCSVTILHRFSSPDWWTHVTSHLSADFTKTDAFNTIVTLKNGEAIVLAPQGLGRFKTQGSLPVIDRGVQQFGRRYLLVKSRKRITADGGASILVLGTSTIV